MLIGRHAFGAEGIRRALMDYVRRYDAGLNFFHDLVAIDGPGRRAVFDVAEPDDLSPAARRPSETTAYAA
ncbi:hypothetical protein DPM13_01330 [Paracoccus mutanolyticus]|uniref:Uncharacterized protein n=1 Tax=Paracoccus mutanolyticus TaxID=1499308 RepID=A0ABN5MB87_9RHOB|nr:hypothetical protein [Paracoccus mutanolyticus]AWX92349.1 hypothetical protein DPM13_01330 [Paracoccus mutanolyticus]